MLHQVIALHLEAFLGAVAEAGDGAGLPQFVEREYPGACGASPRPVAVRNRRRSGPPSRRLPKLLNNKGAPS